MFTCWHDCKGAVAAQDALNDWQLQAPEAAEAKCGLQGSCQGLLRHCLFWQGTLEPALLEARCQLPDRLQLLPQALHPTQHLIIGQVLSVREM